MGDTKEDKPGASPVADPALENPTEWVDEPSPTGNTFGQWWSKNNPLGAKAPPSTPAGKESEAEGKEKEPKAPNATPDDSEADKREEDRFRDIIERWWANLMLSSAPAMENLQGNFSIAMSSARQAGAEAAQSARHMGEGAAHVAKRQADRAAGVAAMRAFRKQAAEWPGRFTMDQPLVETTVKVATWNLWWRHGSWEQRLLAIQSVLKEQKADIICLQEVWAEVGVDGRSQAQELADALGFHVTFDADNVKEGGLKLGNAILSRWPILSTSTKSLPAPKKGEGENEKRICLRADIDGPRGLLQVYTAHLNWKLHESAVRVAQLTEVCKFMEATRKPSSLSPVILCGDLNAVPDSDEIRMLVGKTKPAVDGMVLMDAWDVAGAGPGLTWDNVNPWAARELIPSRRLDYVFAGWPMEGGRGHVTSAALFGQEVIMTGDPSGEGMSSFRGFKGCVPSDHYGVVATVRY